MSESDNKIKEKPPVPPPKEPAKDTSAPKTAQSAFDKVLEQQKILQQSPLMQGKILEQGASEQKVKEITKWQEQGDERRKRDTDTEGSDKVKQKQKGGETVTREAVVRSGDKQGFGGGRGGGHGREGFGGDLLKRQILEKKLSDVRNILSSAGEKAFAVKLSQANAALLVLKPQQMQAIVNQIVQAIQIGKNELGWPELRLILKEHVFSGLRLRFTSKHGSVSIKLETGGRDVKELFEKEAPKIRAALEEKGVKVSEIKVS